MAQELDLDGDELLTLWCDSLIEYGRLCKGRTAAALHGKSFKRYDGQGLDPISTAYGRVQALQALHPLLEEELLTPHPVQISQGCASDAILEFRQEIAQEIREQAA